MKKQHRAPAHTLCSVHNRPSFKEFALTFDRQILRFREKFGRDPRNEPLFFNPDADTPELPTAPQLAAYTDAAIESMKSQGVEAARLSVFRQIHFIAGLNEHLMRSGDRPLERDLQADVLTLLDTKYVGMDALDISLDLVHLGLRIGYNVFHGSEEQWREFWIAKVNAMTAYKKAKEALSEETIGARPS